ncbi:MAG: U32 family peptidase [bacterium]
MLIQCPLNPELFGRLNELVSLGADEFFFGYANGLRDSLSIISMRSAPQSSFLSLMHATEAVREISKLGKKSFITVNGMFYPDEYFDTLISEIAELDASGCDGFIVSDLNLFLRLRKAIPNLYLIASSGAHVMNSRYVKFLQNLGVRRCILPRQLTPDEIKTVISECPGMDFELFMRNEECSLLDGYCAYSHYGDMDDHPACNELFAIKEPLAPGRMQKWWSCGACVLFGLRDTPNLSLKICGRALGYDLIQKDVAFLKKAVEQLDAAENAVEHAEFCQKTHVAVYGAPCRERCYY